ncbi:response regulator transcription factor [Chondromyces crocatus]|uniref:Transcriptional regulator n=1 Tax=Chondromyces crocatus TaxID=52 RepID=A0A0K1EL88_CHOCO|nr:response regulator transcription factor [Chondromyces crocatus]AKT41561.1 transcriptional regulator [Chondromyces crocatus]
MTKHILIVDDETRIRDVVSYALQKEGYRVTAASDGRAALDALEGGGVDLVVLDVMLPEIDGLEVCRRIRARSRIPILFLSARGEEIDRILGLELGGDDYLTKPFSPRELIARARAIFRRTDEPDRAPEERAAVLRFRGIEINPERHEVRYEGRVVPLTPTELGILGALIERPGVVLSRAQLMQRAYRYDNLITERTIDTHIRRIRAKFREAGLDPIATVHGVGYKAAEG